MKTACRYSSRYAICAETQEGTIYFRDWNGTRLYAAETAEEGQTFTSRGYAAAVMYELGLAKVWRVVPVRVRF